MQFKKTNNTVLIIIFPSIEVYILHSTSINDIRFWKEIELWENASNAFNDWSKRNLRGLLSNVIYGDKIWILNWFIIYKFYKYLLIGSSQVLCERLTSWKYSQSNVLYFWRSVTWCYKPIRFHWRYALQ